MGGVLLEQADFTSCSSSTLLSPGDVDLADSWSWLPETCCHPRAQTSTGTSS